MTEKIFCTDSVWNDFVSLAGKNAGVSFPKEKLRVLETVDSTNAALLRELSGSPRLIDDSYSLTDAGRIMHKKILASAHQTSGRGRAGRVFYSPEKTGIYFSFVWIPKSEVLNPAMYTVSAAVGVSRAIDSVCGKESKIKWVNDIYVGEKKVCGILCEGFCGTRSGMLEALVIGIGINLTMGFSDVPHEMLGKAGGIFSEDEKPSEDLRSKLLASSIYEIFSILESVGNVVDEYRKKSMLKNRLVMVRPLAGESDEAYRARVMDISDDAGLLVKLDDGTEKILYSGEVTLH